MVLDWTGMYPGSDRFSEKRSKRGQKETGCCSRGTVYPEKKESSPSGARIQACMKVTD